MERGPDFDMIDPFRPITRDEQVDRFGLAFMPVEVEAVIGRELPFRFRLTTGGV